MNTDLIFVLILALGCVLIGFALASILQGMRDAKEIRDRLPSTVTPTPDIPKNESKPDREEILLAWFEPGQASLQIEIDGRVYRSREEVDEAARNRLGNLLEELSTWTGQATKTVPVETPLTTPVMTSETAIPISLDLSEPNPRPSVLGPFISALQPIGRKGEPKLMSLAEQIDEILQERIRLTPFENRNLKLMNSPKKGLLVRVDGKEYEGIDSVPDESIRDVIRQAVKEWENRVSGP